MCTLCLLLICCSASESAVQGVMAANQHLYKKKRFGGAESWDRAVGFGRCVVETRNQGTEQTVVRSQLKEVEK